MNKINPISFRLDPDSKKQLDKRAENLGVTTSEFARKAVLAVLDDESELAKLRMKVSALEASLLGLREDLAVAVEALLVTRGSDQVITPEQAEAWVSQNMRST